MSRDLAMDQRLYIPVTMVTNCMVETTSPVTMESGIEGFQYANVSLQHNNITTNEPPNWSHITVYGNQNVKILMNLLLLQQFYALASEYQNMLLLVWKDTLMDLKLDTLVPMDTNCMERNMRLAATENGLELYQLANVRNIIYNVKHALETQFKCSNKHW